MTMLETARAFMAEAGAATNLNRLGDLIGGAIGALGFDHYALIHHVSIYRAGSDTVFLHNYPDGWARTLDANGYLLDDPVAAACRARVTPFLWSELPMLLALTARQRAILDGARDAGLAEGFTVPIHIPNEAIGSCSFSTAGPLPLAALKAAQMVGVTGFEAARRLVRRDAVARGRPSIARATLTPRERDCVLLAGRGMSDADAAALLGIAPDAVAGHLDVARHKFGVATRTELVVRALFHAELGFADLIDGAEAAAPSRETSAGDEPAPMSRLGEMFFGSRPTLN